jgi:hypothetical protein
VDQFNLIAQTKVLDYNGAGTGIASWTVRKTSNPASLFLYALTSTYVSTQPVSLSRVDFPSLEEWHAFCANSGYECNAVISSDMTRDQLLDAICTTGRASWHKSQGKYVVVVDKERSSPTQLFSHRNSTNFSASKEFPEQPHALK